MKKSPTVRMIEMQFYDTPFEQIVERGVARGKSMRQIAADLGVSYRLVYRWAERLGVATPTMARRQAAATEVAEELS